ncbi:adenylosuccinate lyase [Sporosarcina sp. 179-K 3D1 HS]|uniref:adenylosuccinate lyase n=1 Tax=Sporosarcina sp. 179-K 3D1 HS TaxID=3232169 RepID=UPI0039A3EC3E
MQAHMIDSALYRDLYGNEKMRYIFSDVNMLKKWIDVEKALAQAESELGVIPTEAYEEISKNSLAEKFNVEEIRKGIESTAHPLITFIRQFEENCAGAWGEYIHYGATTQDIIDTGLILQLKEGYEVIYNQVESMIASLEKVTIRYRHTIMPGRTHGQHALPITLGFKIATWLSEMHRHRVRLEEITDRVFVGQLGGAAGTLASLQENALVVQQRTIEILGLKIPDITWHTSRDNLTELASVYAMIAGTIGKIANEIINLQRTEIAEIEEGFENGKVGSSTMPHKRNPMICEYVVGLSRLVRMQLPLIYDSLVQEHERDMGLWLVELEVMPEMSTYLSRMLEQMEQVLQNMNVNEEKMRSNVDITGGLILSEQLMFYISGALGKQTAHEVVYEASMKAYEKNIPLIDAICQDERVTTHYGREEVEGFLKPENYLGLCSIFIDQVLNGKKDE